MLYRVATFNGRCVTTIRANVKLFIHYITSRFSDDDVVNDGDPARDAAGSICGITGALNTEVMDDGHSEL